MKINTVTTTEVDVASPEDVEALSARIASLESHPPGVTHLEFAALAARVAALEHTVPPPTSKTVLTGAEILAACVGRWAAPDGSGPNAAAGGHDCRRFGFSTAVHTQLSDGDVLLKSHVYDLHGYGVVAPPVPATLNERPSIASIKRWGALNTPQFVPNQSGTAQRGVLQTDNGLFATYAAYYAVSAEDFPSQSREGVGCVRLTGDPVLGYSSPYHHNKVAGYLANPPVGMDADYLVGLCGTSGNGSGSAGPNLFAVKWNNGSPTARMLLGYSLADDKIMPGWDSITTVMGAAWIDTGTKHAVVFSAMVSRGPVWYGGPREVINGVSMVDPWNANKCHHSTDYDQGLWIFDPDNLAAGPREWVSIRDHGLLDNIHAPYGNGVVNHCSPVTASYANGRLILGVAQGYSGNPYESTPLMLQFQF